MILRVAPWALHAGAGALGVLASDLLIRACGAADARVLFGSALVAALAFQAPAWRR